jgi:hypothetical protein
VARGTQVTESWEFLPDGIAVFGERYGPDAEAQIANRTEFARRGNPLRSPRSSRPPKRADRYRPMMTGGRLRGR